MFVKPMCLQICSWMFSCVSVGRNRIEYVLYEFPQFTGDPWGVWNGERQAVLVVGQVDGDEEITPKHDPFPGNVQKGASVPELIQGAIDVAFLDQDDVAVIFGVVSPTGRTVGRDELIDEFLDGGVGGVVGRELAEVFGGFERDHFDVLQKKPATRRA